MATIDFKDDEVLHACWQVKETNAKDSVTHNGTDSVTDTGANSSSGSGADAPTASASVMPPAPPLAPDTGALPPTAPTMTDSTSEMPPAPPLAPDTDAETYEERKARIERDIQRTKKKRARMENMPDGDAKTALATEIAKEEAEDRADLEDLAKDKSKKAPKASFPEAGEVPGRGGGGWDLNQNAKIMTKNSAHTPWDV